VDRCDVLLVDAHLFSAVHGTWTSSQERAELPRPHSFDELPEALTSLLLEAAQTLATLQIDDIEEDTRLDPAGAREIFAALGVRALAALPVGVGDEVAGWLLLQSVPPRTWLPRELANCERMAHDLVASLVQVQAFEQQRESVRRLEELDRAKDAFISTVSHELRTPLTSIVGYLEMLTEGGMGPLEDGVSHGVAIIERNVGRLRDLVEDLLTLSAYDADQVRLDREPTNLSEVVAECLQALVPATTIKDLEVAVVSDPELPPVLADRTQMERVVLNLLSNAIKFSHHGERVTVRLHREAPDVVVTISDTGIGIPVEEQQLLFSRFFRSSLSMEDEIQGTGLGLALVRSVVEWHEGSVELDSVEGDGTTVTVRLPEAP
jgi:signal transduction histidine kinase